MKAKAVPTRISGCLIVLVSIILVHYIMLYFLFDDIYPEHPTTRQERQPVHVQFSDEAAKDVMKLMRLSKASTGMHKSRAVQVSVEEEPTTTEEKQDAINILAQEEQEEPPQDDAPNPALEYVNREMHIVFSTGCIRPSTETSSLILQSTAAAVGHRGPITRIASGCSKEKQQELLTLPTLYPDYRIHFTPAYFPHPVPGINDRYPPYNKPFGLRHWLEHGNVTESLIALIDADFLFLRPLLVNANRSVRYDGTRNPSEVFDTVASGIGVAQDWFNYMKGGLWTHHKKVHEKVCQGRPCGSVSVSEAKEYYSPTGPPYVMLTSDVRRFMDDYCNFTVQVRKEYKTWMSEMYGFAVAAANHGIKFTIASDVGITHPRFGDKNSREYWGFAKRIRGNPCANSSNDDRPTVAQKDLPVALHLCQKYSGLTTLDRDEWWYYKRWQPDMTACETPFLALPPASGWQKAVDAGGFASAELWTQCTSIKTANRAILAYKEKACPSGYNSAYTSRMNHP